MGRKVRLTEGQLRQIIAEMQWDKGTKNFDQAIRQNIVSVLRDDKTGKGMTDLEIRKAMHAGSLTGGGMEAHSGAFQQGLDHLRDEGLVEVVDETGDSWRWALTDKGRRWAARFVDGQ